MALGGHSFNKLTSNKNIINTILVLGAFILFFFSISLISASFRNLSSQAVNSILYATSNPYIGLFIGLLLTAIIQSSSTSTSMIVAIVATGSLSLENAVPMVLGANIGTTLTSSLVALSFVNNKNAFRRAISAGVIHDFYNIILTLILLPLELAYKVLSTPAAYLGEYVNHFEILLNRQVNFSFFSDVSSICMRLVNMVPLKIIPVIIAVLLLLGSIKLISWIIYRRLIGKPMEYFHKFLFTNKFTSFSLGLLFTSAIQSSSVSTSLVVPFVANRKLSLNKCFAFIIGANLGTTLTALLASLFNNITAVTIAMIHVLFNLYGIFILFLFPYLKEITPRLAKLFSRQVQKRRYIGFAYVIIIFFIVPFSLIYFNKGSMKNDAINIKTEQHHDKPLTKTNPNH